MQNEHVLSGSVRKRSEIAGQIEHAQAELHKLMADLEAVNGTIRIFDPGVDLATLPRRRYRPRQPALQGMMRHVMNALRTAEGPITSRDIALTAIAERGLGTDDAALLQTARKRVRACLLKMKLSGTVRDVPIGGELKGWVRAQLRHDVARGLKSRVRANLLYLAKVRGLVAKEGDRETAVWRVT